MSSLADLAPGQSGVVKSCGDEQLLEMGVLPGAEVEMKFTAPPGDPICIRVSGYNLSMRLEAAKTITLIS